MALGMVGLLALAGCSSKSNTSTGATTPAPATSASPTGTAVSLRAGLNDPTNKNIAILQYLPGSVTVTAGTTVTWQIAGPEPHSVTFEPNNGPVPAPGSNPSLFAPTGTATVPYDGTTLVNSGLIPQGPQPASFSLAFSKPGTYVYHCVIHAQMSGTVTVVPAGTTADTQAAISARGDTELAQWQTEGEAAAKTFASTAAKSTTNANGSKTWTVLMGTSTAHTDILAFSPVSSTVKPGDKVVFENDSAAPHTATFAGSGTIPQDPESVTATTAAPGKSPQTLNATGFFNTGTLPPNAPPGAGPPLVARQYTYTVATAGTFPYVCIYHAGSGMGGAITAS
ncbi:MAG TPA: plastocyanin/azurin family copper-binding protein [Actinomycetota bacterium]|nr:plastocyanin/azurin family copper-binding protein [Actinomycetota bacterium]